METLGEQRRPRPSVPDMIEPALTEDNLCRLAVALIQRFGGSYADAMSQLERLHLHVVVGGDVAASPALQAALLTTVNAGKRAFLGGVTVELLCDGDLLLPWSHATKLSAVVTELGGRIARSPDGGLLQTLCIGNASSSMRDALSVWVADWRGGIAPADSGFSLPGRQDFPTAGVMAAAFGLARGFVQLTGLSSHFVERPSGFSLWRPDLAFDDPKAIGPKLEFLPERLWLAGLGHLGQAYVWNLCLLPYQTPGETRFFLQDFDRVVKGNMCAGLLCDERFLGLLKTRLCMRWLEARGFQTHLIERRFDETLRLQTDEPMVALCGFDSVVPRRALSGAPFRLIVDCGIGDSHDSFDQLSLYTFPGANRSPEQIWGAAKVIEAPANPHSLAAFDQKQVCGVLAETLARKAVATSFVGAFAGSLATAEILRGLHNGTRCEAAAYHLRSNSPPRVAMLDEAYASRASFAGCTKVIART